MSAADNLYAELTRGVAHAQVRQHLIDEHRAEVLADFVDRCAIALAGCCPECDAAMAIMRGRVQPTLDGAPVPERGIEQGKGTGTTGGEPTPPADFFQAGRTYTDGNGFRAPELTVYFHAEHITRHPVRGHLRAIGWAKSGATGAEWHGNFLDEDDFAGWTELEEPLLSAAPAVARPRRTDAERRDWLLSVITSERGQWTVGRVKRLYGRYCEGHVLRSTIRRELAALYSAGELEMHHESDRRYYTLSAGGAR